MIFILCLIGGLLFANLLLQASRSKKKQNSLPPQPPYGYDAKYPYYPIQQPPLNISDKKEVGIQKEGDQTQQRFFYTLLFLFIIIALLLYFK